MKEGRGGESREVGRVGGRDSQTWKSQHPNSNPDSSISSYCVTFSKLNTSFPVLLFSLLSQEHLTKATSERKGSLGSQFKGRAITAGKSQQQRLRQRVTFCLQSRRKWWMLCSPCGLPLIQLVGPIPRDSISHVWVALPAPIKADETTPHRYTRDCLLCGSLSSWWSTLAITLCAQNNSNMPEPPKPRQQQDHLERILQSPHNEDKVIETKLTPLKHQEK